MIEIKIFIVIAMILFTLVGIKYYKGQNTITKMGGPISSAKCFWLFAVLFLYYISSIAIWSLTIPSSFRTILTITICIMFFRAIVQSFLMYQDKSWLPIYGILFNIGTAVIIGLGMIQASFVSQASNGHDQLIVFFLTLLQGVLLLDTFYAYQFQKVIGRGTQGEKAIWYASSSDSRFDSINKTTYYFNFILMILLLILMYKILLL